MDDFEVSPKDFAKLQGFDKGSFIRACRKGKTQYAGWPIGDWVVREEDGRTVDHLRIPAEEVERLLGLEEGTLTEWKQNSDWPQGRRTPSGPSGSQAKAANVGSHFDMRDAPESPKELAADLVAGGVMSVAKALGDWLTGRELGQRTQYSDQINLQRQNPSRAGPTGEG